jgi:hypothetical protein|tara:strand:- start:682 stop:918 length:237 start_codon:yes stop_codon:yes gene_type:complete
MMIVKPLATEKAAGDASIAEARLVRLVNTGSTEVVTVANATPASFTLVANTSIIIEKEIGAAIGATASVKATVVAFTA